MQFEYFYAVQARGTIDIEDIGNCSLSLTNDQYKEYIIIIKTEYGKTKVIQYGPRWIDREEPCISVNYTYNEFQFSSSKIEKIIEKALNGFTLCTQATLITEQEALERVTDLVNYL